MNRLLSLDELDTSCVAQWREGALDSCRDTARQMRERAAESGELGQEARAELHLALCDQRQAQFPSALAAARRAAALSRVAGDTELEVEALALVCAAGSVLGKTDSALEAGCLALQLATQCPGTLAAVQATDVLGLAQAWIGQTDAARGCFASGAGQAQAAGRTDWEAHLLIHAAFAEALMLAMPWDPAAGLPTPQQRRRVEQALDAAMVRCEVTPGVMSASTQRSGRFLLGWAELMLSCWRGDAELAANQLEGLRPLAQHERAWLDMLVTWAAVAIAALRRDWQQVETQACQMLEQAQLMGHQPLVEQARRLLVMTLERPGRMLRGAALQAFLAHPAYVASQALHQEMAVFELRLRDLPRRPIGLPAWRREDSLTGLASREHFQAQAEELLQRTDPARAQVSVLVLALDPGQVLAAHHSALVRDRVLCTLAALLRQVLRAGDLPARWSHDELSALLQRASGDDAARAGQRVLATVRAHDWSGIAPGLEVRVCLGHASARVGDTLDAMMRRCESARFASLRREYRRVPDAA
jgi:diguanylate cyclase (GGDEF)-like protein